MKQSRKKRFDQATCLHINLNTTVVYLVYYLQIKLSGFFMTSTFIIIAPYLKPEWLRLPKYVVYQSMFLYSLKLPIIHCIIIIKWSEMKCHVKSDPCLSGTLPFFFNYQSCATMKCIKDDEGTCTARIEVISAIHTHEEEYPIYRRSTTKLVTCTWLWLCISVVYCI